MDTAEIERDWRLYRIQFERIILFATRVVITDLLLILTRFPYWGKKNIGMRLPWIFVLLFKYFNYHQNCFALFFKWVKFKLMSFTRHLHRLLRRRQHRVDSWLTFPGVCAGTTLGRNSCDTCHNGSSWWPSASACERADWNDRQMPCDTGGSRKVFRPCAIACDPEGAKALKKPWNKRDRRAKGRG